MSKELARRVSGIIADYGRYDYPAGTKEEDIHEDVLPHITNPKAWKEPTDEEAELEALRKAASANAALGEDDPAPGDEDDDVSSMTVNQLREYAEEHEIDLGGATRKRDILKAIRATEGGEDAGDS